MPCPPPDRLKGRNAEWKYLHNKDVISMPDKWEYPWVCITLSRSFAWITLVIFKKNEVQTQVPRNAGSAFLQRIYRLPR